MTHKVQSFNAYPPLLSPVRSSKVCQGCTTASLCRCLSEQPKPFVNSIHHPPPNLSPPLFSFFRAKRSPFPNPHSRNQPVTTSCHPKRSALCSLHQHAFDVPRKQSTGRYTSEKAAMSVQRDESRPIHPTMMVWCAAETDRSTFIPQGQTFFRAPFGAPCCASRDGSFRPTCDKQLLHSVSLLRSIAQAQRRHRLLPHLCSGVVRLAKRSLHTRGQQAAIQHHRLRGRDDLHTARGT